LDGAAIDLLEAVGDFDAPGLFDVRVDLFVQASDEGVD
jgi:hypothetical protein